MKTTTMIVRLLIGGLFLFASVSFFLKLAPETETTGSFKVFQVGLMASSYLMPLAKAVELSCGLAFILNRFVALSNIVILPVTLNILLINYFLSPDKLPIAVFIFFGNLFLIYSYWGSYKNLFISR